MHAVRLFSPVILLAFSAFAQTTSTATLTFNPGSTVKVEQLLGDMDYQTKLPTASQTVTRFNVLGSDIGYSFERNDGKLMFTFGDTISKDSSALNYHAGDPLASSNSTDPNAPLLLDFYTARSGSGPLFVKPPGVVMGADDVPNSGIALADGIYLIANTGADTSLDNPHVNDSSVLVKFDETAQTFTAGRTISRMPSGHFIITAPHLSGSDVYMWGAGAYRASDVFLSKTPAASFASGAGTQYFAGLTNNGQPLWTDSESGAVPVVQDNPLNGPAWPNDTPSVGNISVAYSKDLNLWLMTYDGGRQSPKTAGVYFTYAPQPWGPWAAPQLIFGRQDGLGVFIHDPSIQPDPPGDGLNGPTIGQNDIYSTHGGGYAPLMIERFTTVSGNTLRIQFTLSTWNPYTIVRMRSDFTISNPQLTPAYSNVNYFGDTDPAHRLDLYLPSGAGPFPLVVFIHGGGWSAGSKELAVQYFQGLPSRGFAVASISYRLTNEAIFPAQIQDCKAAVRFLRGNAAKYNLDPNRIAAMGDSAGAHLAALVATTSDQTLWDTPAMPNASTSSRVQALVTLAAPLAGIFSTTDSASAFSDLLGCPSVSACPDKVNAAMPLTYVTADDPPALLLQGTNDPITGADNARIFDEAMLKAGRPAVYRMLPGALHVEDPVYQSPQIAGLIQNFLERTLNESPSTTAAADYEYAQFAPNQYISTFGSYVGNQQLIPDPGPLPTSFGGFSATVKDSSGRTQPLGIGAVLPGQLNMLLPASLASGTASLTVFRGGQTEASEQIPVSDITPTLFSVYIGGSAMAVGQVTWVDGHGNQQVRPLIVPNGSQLEMPALPFTETPGMPVVTLYGSGLGAGKTVVAYLKDKQVTVTYAGKQGQYDGLDQYNIQIPRLFAGQGALTLSISVDGNPGTPLRLVN